MAGPRRFSSPCGNLKPTIRCSSKEKFEVTTALNLTGQMFGRWRVVGVSHTVHNKKFWRCACQCGADGVVSVTSLRSGYSRSCGCLKSEINSRQAIERNTKHGHAIGATWDNSKRSPTYRSWLKMISRCENPKHPAFHRYGGRGVEICDHWRNSFEAFLADMGPRPEGKTLDRWPNNDDGYHPGNCRWATPKEQIANRSAK